METRLTRLSGALGSLLRIVEGADVGPTSQVVEAIEATARELEEALIAWARMRGR